VNFIGENQSFIVVLI